MSFEEFKKFLTSIPNQEYHHRDEAVPSIISETTSTLGYSHDNVFHEVSLGESNTTYADAIIASQITARPYIVINVQHLSTSTTTNTKSDLLNQKENFRADYAATIAPRRVYYTDEETVNQVSLVEPSTDAIKRLYDCLERPVSLPTEPVSQFYDNKNIRGTGIEPQASYGRFFDINLTKYRHLYNQVVEASTNKEKKESLEGTAALLFNSISCLGVRSRNLRTSTGEIDLLVEYTPPDQQTIFDEYGKYILVECKHWRTSVGADEIRKFCDKLRETKIRFGVLFARNGITGEDSNKNAFRRVDDAFQQDGIIILVITQRDLEVIKEHADFYEMLEMKLFNRRFRRPTSY